MILYIARHGQTTGDEEGRYGGDYDDQLSKLGKQQAVQLAEKLTDKGIEMLFASPRMRAQETANYISQKLDLPIITLSEIREWNRYGILTGMEKSAALQTYPHEVVKLKTAQHSAEGGEDYQSFGTRIAVALASVCTNKAERVLIVAHGGPIKFVLRDVLTLGEAEVADCAYIALRTTDDGYKLVETNGVQFDD